MNNTLLSFAALAIVLSTGARSSVAEIAKADLQAVVGGGNQFAFDLLTRLSEKDGNLFFSPYSIRTALAMTYAGARARTAEQMAAVLHFSLAQDQVPPAFASLVGELNNSSKGPGGQLFELIVANALWAQKGFPFHKDFVDLLQADYGGELQRVDFTANPESIRQQINDWAAKQTKDKIKDLLPQGIVNQLTRLVLTNAIYFKSSWDHPFYDGLTKDEPFHVSGDKTTPVPMMRLQESFGYYEDSRLQAVSLPYGQGRLAMIVLLPRKVDGVVELTRDVKPAFSNAISRLRSRPVNIMFPKFKLTAQFSLRQALESMGMRDAFDDNAADFSGMATAERLFIRAVIHKAFVDVDEKGTEAAAATAVTIGLAAMPVVQKPVSFVADHPFLFLIQHQQSKEILFVGRVINPKS